MKKERLHLYNIDMKYVRNLSKVDDNVMSVSPQTSKENRPFVGIVVVCDNKPYCIPLTSPKPKHEKMKNDKDFHKMYDKKGNFIGAINFNNMIPVDKNVIKMVDVKIYPNDPRREYKGLLNDQLDWCNKNSEIVINKAVKLYDIVTRTPDKMRNLTRRCCNFQKLERVLEKYVVKSEEEPQKGQKQSLKAMISKAAQQKKDMAAATKSMEKWADDVQDIQQSRKNNIHR